ncbi:MAG: MFS transporter [Gammaproteobacteria bacterium]|nr:MFS transporter [Gammaproteobacteria bacterium]MYD02867.1 MFS transporter [Gammaproteobacteria bacterium]MYI24444.1 MFS transporter [Gammaproteobacteria bacterium]
MLQRAGRTGESSLMNNLNKPPYPSPKRSWYMVVLLTLAYFISYIDRTVIGLLVEPMKADLGLTDGQMGLLLGLAFGIFYATMGLPLGWLADRTRRVTIVSCAIALWSAATAFCGLASNYLQLFLLRMSVGVGEAALSPCTMSMIADSFPKEKRGKAIAVYSMALSLGTATAYYAIGALLAALRGVEVLNWPLVGAIRPWQAVFIIVGLPGLLLALVMLTVREPTRRDLKLDDVRSMRSVPGLRYRLGPSAPWLMFRHVFTHWKTYLTFVLPFCLMTTVAYTHFWMPAVFSRTWGMDTPEFAQIKAVVTLVCAPATVFAAGALSDYLVRRGRDNAPLLIAVAGAFVFAPTGFLIALMPGTFPAFAVMGVSLIGIATTTSTGVTALLMITPAQFRGQITAVYYMAISITGLLLGPSTVGWLSDWFNGGTGVAGMDALVEWVLPGATGAKSLALAFAAVPLLYGSIVLALAPVTLRCFRRELVRVQSQAA